MYCLSYLTLLVLLALPRLVNAAAPAVPAVTNGCEGLRYGVVLEPPQELQGLSWLTGKWVCIDRALRRPPSELDTYAVLDWMEFDAHSIAKSIAYPGGYTLAPRCAFIPFGDGKQVGTNVVSVEFSMKGFYFNMPAADPLRIKAEPGHRPSWLVLEHTVTRSVLLFRRLPQAASTR